MAAADVVPKMPSSFVYEDLISKVQAIQLQIIESTKLLAERQENEKKVQNELKSRSLTFVDPYGHSIVHQCMDHELINTVFKKYKKEYVPKYLQKWIKFGTKSENEISPLTDSQLKLTVSEYEDGFEFITFGEVIVWTGNDASLSRNKIVLRVLLTDNIETIKIHLNKRQQFSNIELKSIIINQNTSPNNKSWNEGNILKIDDTIVSCQLYRENCIIMAKLTQANVSLTFVLLIFHDFVCFCRSMVKLQLPVTKYL
jgi:hypothetical protein